MKAFKYFSINYVCPVCGFNRLDKPPFSENGAGSFEICPSCKTQFGYSLNKDSWEKQKNNLRQKWIENGMKFWADSFGDIDSEKPKNWNPHEQLQKLLIIEKELND